jgi:hypothetical protein
MSGALFKISSDPIPPVASNPWMAWGIEVFEGKSAVPISYAAGVAIVISLITAVVLVVKIGDISGPFTVACFVPGCISVVIGLVSLSVFLSHKER